MFIPRKTIRQSKGKKQGFTLWELTLSTGLSAIVVAAMLTAFFQQRKTYWNQKLLNDMNQNLRAAMTMILRDVRMANYGVKASTNEFSQWFDWGPAVSSNPHIEQGATTNDSDTITVISALAPPASTMASATNPGDTILNVASGDGSKFNATDKKIIFVGRLEMARIVSVSGDQLTVSTDPTQAGQGLTHGYPTGARIELVETISYSCEVDGTENLLYLVRDNNTSGQSDPDRRMAVGIEDMQVSTNAHGVNIQLTARTEEEDGNYTHPVKGDGYRRRTLSSQVTLRN